MRGISVSLTHRGLSLIEVLIVVTLIAVMMALSLPMLSTANAEARSAVCRQNLADMALAVSSYTNDLGHLPSLHALPPEYQGQSLPEWIAHRVSTPYAVFCPSDETEASQTLGTSYRWNSAYNGLKLSELSKTLHQPLLSDRDAYHIGSATAMNEVVLSRDESGYLFTVPGGDSAMMDTARPGLRLGTHKRPGAWPTPPGK